jgi:hypothetical protein
MNSDRTPTRRRCSTRSPGDRAPRGRRASSCSVGSLHKEPNHQKVRYEHHFIHGLKRRSLCRASEATLYRLRCCTPSTMDTPKSDCGARDMDRRMHPAPTADRGSAT